jgi:hypothetical protein
VKVTAGSAPKTPGASTRRGAQQVEEAPPTIRPRMVPAAWALRSLGRASVPMLTVTS